jgi:hypothetical protein
MSEALDTLQGLVLYKCAAGVNSAGPIGAARLRGGTPLNAPAVNKAGACQAREMVLAGGLSRCRLQCRIQCPAQWGVFHTRQGKQGSAMLLRGCAHAAALHRLAVQSMQPYDLHCFK